MLKIGLTGGIGAGKSAVASRLAALGAVIVDADVLAREVVAPGTDGLADIVAAFGREVLGPDGALDRPALGARVFGDDDARRDLERIIHPRVRSRTAELVAAAPPDAIVVNDVPLLVETGLAPTYHLVIVVTAAEATRVGRLARTRGMAQAEAYARIRAQATDAQRAAAADVLLRNDAALADLDTEVLALWRDRLVPYEANLREGRPAPAPTAARDADPAWPAQAARLTARLAHVAGPRARRVDHVGPTAVPGLAALDLITLQVVVADLGAAAAVAHDAAAAGLVPARRVRSAGPPTGTWYGSTGPDGVPLASADPGRPAQVQIHVADSPAWRSALLWRDWLRADGDARKGHERDPEALDAAADAVALDAAALDRAERWAAATGWAP